ncbi:MAG TPA: DNA-binding response regulator [Cupriavidus sp.]|nr:DNA-binding response regulator [Cupriavidus sp.]
MGAIVIESHPLTRLGMQRLLERMPGIGPVESIDPEGILLFAHSLEDVLGICGMTVDAFDNWYLLRRLHQALPNARILLLSDNMWMHVPSSLRACGVQEHLPKSASIERMETVLVRMLGDPDVAVDAPMDDSMFRSHR